MTEQLPFPPSGVPYVRGSDTSETAAESVEAVSGRLEAAVYELIVRAGQRGMTDDEIETATGLTHQCASARRRTLVLKGLICDSGQRRLTRRSRPAVVWIVGSEDFVIEHPIDKPPSRPPLEQLRTAVRDLAIATELAQKHAEHVPSEELRALYKWLVHLTRESQR